MDIPISAIEHYSYCARQCALIYVEQTWDENVYTVRGSLAHERVDAGEPTTERGVRALRSVTLWSERLGLRGKSDLVELRPEGPYPVEYKVGVRHGDHAALQVCAQALCLEEMLGVEVRRGAIFTHADRRREEVTFDATLRQRTEEAIVGVRALLVRQALPAAPNDARCRRCSLIHACLPSVVGERARLRGLQGALFRPLSLS
ncbi:MAG: CRISPR-associated protein Cas4 [Chloroflexi bacterium]|nr:CRISPR-associated protein Cas4 [Chloroflexota bacterium]